MLNLLGITVSESAYKVLMTFKVIGFILLALCALTLIVVILMQTTAEGRGTNVLTGVSDTYYAQNKNHTREGVLKKITIACAIIIFIVAILLAILLKVKA